MKYPPNNPYADAAFRYGTERDLELTRQDEERCERFWKWMRTKASLMYSIKAFFIDTWRLLRGKPLLGEARCCIHKQSLNEFCPECLKWYRTKGRDLRHRTFRIMIIINFTVILFALSLLAAILGRFV